VDQVDNLEAAATSVFEITVPSATVQLTDGRGDASYNVRNLTSRPLHARAASVPTPPALESWLNVDQPDRNFNSGVVEQVPVHVQLPKGVAPGTYGFRLDVTGVDNPDEEFGHGPGVTFTVSQPPPPPPPPPDRRWMFVVAIVAAVVLIGAGVAAFLFVRPVPDVKTKTRDAATQLLAAKDLSVGSVTDKPTGGTPGTVSDQEPAAGSFALRDSKVSLVLESPVVPQGLIGLQLAVAQRTLQAAGLSNITVTNVLQVGPAGIVRDVQPGGGQQAQSDAVVTLVVSSCPNPPLCRPIILDPVTTPVTIPLIDPVINDVINP